MKNLTTLLRKGSLTPKERIILWVHNNVHKDKTGKEILTEAEKHGLCEGWTPKNHRETDEYNKYNKGANLAVDAILDAQGIYLRLQNSILRSSRFVDYAMHTDLKNKRATLFEHINLDVDENQALELIVKNTGLNFDNLIYSLAFQNTSEDLKKDILSLCPDAKTESQYLDQEEILADLFDGQKSLTQEAKEKLADLILGELYNKYNEIFIKKGLKPKQWWFSGYFAELPTLEIAKKWADYSEIYYEADSEKLEDELSEKIQDYAEKNKVEARELLKKTILRWLDDGLFVKEYIPICNSNSKNTCNDVSTKLSHKEVLKKWLEVKTEAKSILQKLIDSGELKVEFREKDFYGMKEAVKIITGESLYNFSRDFLFIRDFKIQVDNFKTLGYLILFLRNRDFLKGYASLLAFVDIYKKLSRIYEIDLGYKIVDFIEESIRSIEQLNRELKYIAERLEETVYHENNITFLAEFFLENLLFSLEGVQPGTGETETHYANKFQEILKDEF